jgi:F0F1-type ATP synthase assembly protein I
MRDRLDSSPSNDTRLSHRVSKPVGRILLLAGCIIVGCVIGFVGEHFSGSSAWFLAVPGLMALSWLFVANPDECLPDGKCRLPPDDSADG